jgi:hypothetical protein
MTPLASKALELALADDNKAELPRGSNWGKYVQSLLSNVGINFAAPWCAAFVFSKFKDAAAALGVENPVYKTGGVLKLWQQEVANRVTVPQAGDVFIMDFGKGTGHTGFVYAVEGDYVLTVEGNTNDEGSREGFEVAKRKRPIKGMLGFLRF